MANERETKTVLIIEDEDDIRNFAARVLEIEGFHVLQAEDGDNGLEIARRETVALVLLDLSLPKRDGWSVLARMKDSPSLSLIPVVVFTASAEAARREKALSMGVADYLVKPLSAANLKDAVVRILHGGE